MKKLMGGVFSFVLTAGAVLLMAVFGLGMLATGSGEHMLAAALPFFSLRGWIRGRRGAAAA